MTDYSYIMIAAVCLGTSFVKNLRQTVKITLDPDVYFLKCVICLFTESLTSNGL